MRATMLLPLLVVVIAALVVSPAAASCSTDQRCGGLEIPYPFGVGRGCYLDPGDGGRAFEVACSSGGKATVDGGRLEVLDIDVPRGKLRVRSGVSGWCYNTTLGDMGNESGGAYNSTVFRVSDADNELTVVGCGTLGYIGTQEGAVDNQYAFGCNASCPLGQRSLLGGGDSACNGTDGCCRMKVPAGIGSFDFGFTDSVDNRSGSFSQCVYAFLVSRNTFKYRTSYVTNRELIKGGAAGEKLALPLVLDWAVGNLTCPEAKKNKAAYACSANSDCINATNGIGYLCNCSRGYQGNPYRSNGCKFIDHCKEKGHRCPHYATCVNTNEGPICESHCPLGRRLSKANGVGKCEIDYYSLAAIGTSVGVVVLAVVLSCTYAIKEKQRLAAIKKSYFKQHGGLLLFEELRSQQQRRQPVSSFTLFTKSEVEEATSKFDERHVLGKGGNGTVYRGELRDGRAVAIKRCRVAADERQRREFGKEVLILSQVNHRNIVKLYGCCLEVEVPMLVYQFIPNGTLCDLLHGAGEGQPPPPLALRLKVAHEAAEALAYLHSMASPPIIHGDVKSPNILLDEGYAAKVSDFGASVLAPTDEAHLVTLVQGTCGYLDPEYMQTCRLTDKSDVYSFGVVLLELLTRRKALVLAAPEGERSLAAHFLSAARDGRLVDLVDAGIKGEATGEVLEMFATLAKRCLEMSGDKRPSMREVAEELHRIRKLCRHAKHMEIV